MFKLSINYEKLKEGVQKYKIFLQKNLAEEIKKNHLHDIVIELGDKIISNIVDNIETQTVGVADDYTKSGVLIGSDSLDMNEPSTLRYKSQMGLPQKSLMYLESTLIFKTNYYNLSIGNVLSVGLIGEDYDSESPLGRFQLSQTANREKNYGDVFPDNDPKFKDVVIDFLKKRIIDQLKSKNIIL